MKRLFLTISIVFLLTQLATAQPPSLLNYQGVLKDNAGNVVPDGTYQLTFILYDAATGGTTLWTEIHPTVSTVQGIFNVILGGTTALNLPFDQQYYLGITVGADPEMAPRSQLTSAPYAMNTKFANYTPDFLTVDGVLGPSIAFKEGTGNMSVTVSTSTKCNIIIYATAEAATSSWFATVLQENGATVAKDTHLSTHGAELPANVLIHARTLEPSDGTKTYLNSISAPGGTIAKNKFVIHAIPIQ